MCCVVRGGGDLVMPVVAGVHDKCEWRVFRSTSSPSRSDTEGLRPSAGRSTRLGRAGRSTTAPRRGFSTFPVVPRADVSDGGWCVIGAASAAAAGIRADGVQDDRAL